MARLGISTGTTPNDGTGDTLLTGATKVNSNFSEVYGVIGDGTNAYVGIVTQIVAGSNIGINSAYGSVTITGAGQTAEVRANTLVVSGVTTVGVVTGATSIQATKYYGDGSELSGISAGSTAEVRANTLVVTGVSTLGVVTSVTSIQATKYYGDGSELTGVGNTTNVRTNSLVASGIVTATSFVGSGVNLTGITTLISAGSNITVTTNSGITTIASSAGSGSTAEVRANTLVVSGVSTVGIITASQILVTGISSISDHLFIGAGRTAQTGVAGTDWDSVTLSGLSPSSFNQTYQTQSTGFVLDTGTVGSGNALFHADSNYYYYVATTGTDPEDRMLIWSVEDGSWVTVFDLSDPDYREGNVTNNQAVGTVFTDTVTANSANTSGRNTPVASGSIVYGSTTGITTTGVGVTIRAGGNAEFAGIVTATSFTGSGVNLTGITTLISAGSNITVTTNSGITTIASSAGGGSTAEVRANTLVVSGVTTASDVNITGIVTAGIGTIRSLRVGAGVGAAAPNGQLAVVNPNGTAALTVGQNVDGTGTNHLGFYYNGPGAPVAAQVFTSNGALRFVTDGGGGGSVPLNQQAGIQFGVNGNFANAPLVAIHDVTAATGVSTSLVVNGNTLLNDGLTVTGVSTAGSFEGDGSDLVSGRWTLGANGITDYTFTGIGFTVTTNDPVLYLARGRVYEFVNGMGAHGFEIRESEGGSAYNAGVTNNGTLNGTVKFEIPMDAPNTLYYQCTSHSGMGNTISVYPNTI